MAHQSLDWSNWEAVRARKAAAAEPTVEMDERERLAVMLLQEKKAAVRKLIGPAKLKAQEPHFECPEWAAKPDSGVHLAGQKQGATVETILIDKSPYYLLGRNKEVCDVETKHPSTSRVHCAVVHHENKTVYVLDLSTAHGTFVNGRKLQPMKPAKLTEGDELRLGASSRTFKLVTHEPPAKRQRPNPANQPAQKPGQHPQNPEAEAAERAAAARAAENQIRQHADASKNLKAKADFWGNAEPGAELKAADARAAGPDADHRPQGSLHKISHLLVCHADSAYVAQGVVASLLSPDEAVARAQQLRQSILLTTDGRGVAHAFTKAVKKDSDCPVTKAKKGLIGKLGTSSAIPIPDFLSQAAMKLPEDSVSDPIETELGVHILYRHINA